MHKFLALVLSMACVLTPAASRADDGLFSEKEVAHILKVVKESGQKMTDNEIKKDDFRSSLNELLRNESVEKAFAKKYELAKDEKSARRLYRDYVVQVAVYYCTTEPAHLSELVTKNPPKNGASFDEFPLNKKSGEKLNDASAEYFFVSVASNDMKAIKIESAPSSATVEIDGIVMKNPTDNVFFFSKEKKHTVKLALDKYKDHEVQDFDVNKASDLTVKLTLK